MSNSPRGFDRYLHKESFVLVEWPQEVCELNDGVGGDASLAARKSPVGRRSPSSPWQCGTAD
jgi:hypothetical protein